MTAGRTGRSAQPVMKERRCLRCYPHGHPVSDWPVGSSRLRQTRTVVDDTVPTDCPVCGVGPEQSSDPTDMSKSVCSCGHPRYFDYRVVDPGYGLPDGWTLDRIRRMGVKNPRLMPLDTIVLEDRVDDLVELTPVSIVDCGGLCLVLDADDGKWHMGTAGDDGQILCWVSCGSDLAAAIKAL